MARKNIQLAAIAPFGLRIPPEVKSRLEGTARANNRSMNAEINHMIEESLARRSDLRSKLPPGLFKPRPEGSETPDYYNPWEDQSEVKATDAIDQDLLEELAAGLLRLARRLPGEDIAGALHPTDFYRFAVAELDKIQSTDSAEVVRVFDELMARAAQRFGWPEFVAEGPDFQEDEPGELP